jgi:hypothetical protein
MINTKNTTYNELKCAVEQAATHFQQLYLDWVNNFLTVERFAEYYGLDTNEAEKQILIGRKIHNQRTGKI